MTTDQTTTTNTYKRKLQAMIYLTEKVEELEGQLKQSRTEKASLTAEVSSLKERITELEMRAAERKAMLQSALTRVEANYKIVASEIEIQLRAELVREWQAGKAETWDVEEIFAHEEELKQMRATEAANGGSLIHTFEDIIALDASPKEGQVEQGGQDEEED